MTSATDSTALPAERLRAHAEWLARGRTGVGRLELQGETLVGSLEGSDLRHATFDSCRLASLRLHDARLDGARLERCSLEGADLRRASLVDTRFEGCDLRRAMLAGAVVAKTGFLRCAFGDFGSQPVGKPDVVRAYAVVAPDLSANGDGSRIGAPAEIDARWFVLPTNGPERRFVFEGDDAARFVALVLHMHVAWSRESGPRLEDRVVHQTFGQFLDDGAPAPFGERLPAHVASKLRELVTALHAVAKTDGANVP